MPRVVEALVTLVILLAVILALYRAFRWIIGVNELKELRREKTRLLAEQDRRTNLLLHIFRSAHNADVVSELSLAKEIMTLISDDEPAVAHHAAWSSGDFTHEGEGDET